MAPVMMWEVGYVDVEAVEGVVVRSRRREAPTRKREYGPCLISRFHSYAYRLIHFHMICSVEEFGSSDVQ